MSITKEELISSKVFNIQLLNKELIRTENPVITSIISKIYSELKELGYHKQVW